MLMILAVKVLSFGCGFLFRWIFDFVIAIVVMETMNTLMLQGCRCSIWNGLDD